tara:strand:- start:7290 stop:8063 length:774 start_codon:yes stop_codon:yes gene_type:complete
MTILHDIVADKKQYVDYLKTSDYLVSLEHYQFDSVSFKDSLLLKGLSLIAEVKKASPSKGVINSDFDPLVIAKSYMRSGASALSVLTDERFFQGHNDYLMAIKNHFKLPVLRKDFMIDPIQIKESSLIGADAILLIVSILSVNQAQELIDCARQYNLDILCEVHDGDDLDKVSCLNHIDIIGINNRNLKNFDVDLSRSLTMKQQIDDCFDDVICIAESGYDQVDQLDKLIKAGFFAVLIGEGLVKNLNMINYFNNET